MIEDKSIINTFINASIESAAQPPIHFELFKSDLISQFHTLIAVPFGLGKTSKADQIPNSFKLYNYSLPGMVGTINQDGELIESALLNAKKKVLVVDEGHRMGNDARDALLNLLSNGYYSRSMGYKLKVKKSVGTKKSGFMIKPNKSMTGFELFAQFSCVYFCEWLPTKLLKAFLSRFIPIILNTDIDDVYTFARGKSILGTKIKKFDFTIYKDPITVPKELHLEFVNKHEQLTKRFADNFVGDTKGYISRNIVNLIRLAAHFARMDGKQKILWKHFEQVIPLIIPTMKFTLQMKLTPRQFEIMSMMKAGMNQKEIAIELDISEPAVSDIVSSIKRKGMIE